MDEKKTRKANWSATEVACLVDGISRRYRMLFGQFGGVLTPERRELEWKNVASEVNAVGISGRDVAELKKKWQNLRSGVKEKILKSKKEAMKTGGGLSSVPMLDEISQKIFSACGPETFLGISGGYDTAGTEKETNNQFAATTMTLNESVALHDDAEMEMEMDNGVSASFSPVPDVIIMQEVTRSDSPKPDSPKPKTIKSKGTKTRPSFSERINLGRELAEGQKELNGMMGQTIAMQKRMLNVMRAHLSVQKKRLELENKRFAVERANRRMLIKILKNKQ